mmetsp:Transcript_65366/g.156282  ORF Transcript_65366/g.156282 Transcript_65366/m.156282 type:complete len:443 (+) Transcript_65366:145-1473(+)
MNSANVQGLVGPTRSPEQWHRCRPSLNGSKSPFHRPLHLPSLDSHRVTQSEDLNGSKLSAMSKSTSLPSLSANTLEREQFVHAPSAQDKPKKSRPRPKRLERSYTVSRYTPDIIVEAPPRKPGAVDREVLATPSTVAGQSPTASSMVSSPWSAPPSKPNSRSSGEVLGWRRGREIGNGSYGSVFLAQDLVDGHTFAVKAAKLDERDEGDRKFCDKLRQELEVCRDLRHRHIVSCLGHDYVRGRLYIYLEYVPGGSLRSMLNNFGALEGALLQKATRGILKGLHYLHTHEPPIVHRDLKGANVLVDLNFCMKLADFGCSKRDVRTNSFSTVGSLHWVAPEVVQQSGHGRKADIWSLGCVLIEMVTAQDPWGNGAFDNFMHGLRVIGYSEDMPPIPEATSSDGRDFLSRCLIRNPEERASTTELVLHPLTQGLGSRSGSRGSIA